MTSDNASSFISTPVLKGEEGKIKTQELARIIEEVFFKQSNEPNAVHVNNNNIGINNERVLEKDEYDKKEDDSSLHILNKKDNIASPSLRKGIMDEKDESRLKIMKNNFLKKKKMFQKKYTVGNSYNANKNTSTKDDNSYVLKPKSPSQKGKLPITYSQIISYETFKKNIIENKNLDLNKQNSKVGQDPLGNGSSSRKLFMFQNSRMNHLQHSGFDKLQYLGGLDLKKKSTLYEDIKSFEKKNKILATPALKVRNCGLESPSLSIKPGFSYQISLREAQSHRNRKKNEDKD